MKDSWLKIVIGIALGILFAGVFIVVMLFIGMLAVGLWEMIVS